MTDDLIDRLRGLLHPLKMRMDMHAAEPAIREAADEIERLTTNGIHSCHHECPRLPCVQQREIERLTAERDALRSLCAAAYQVMGAADGPSQMLDNLAAAASGDALPHDPGAGLPWAPATADRVERFFAGRNDSPLPEPHGESRLSDADQVDALRLQLSAAYAAMKTLQAERIALLRAIDVWTRRAAQNRADYEAAIVRIRTGITPSVVEAAHILASDGPGEVVRKLNEALAARGGEKTE